MKTAQNTAAKGLCTQCQSEANRIHAPVKKSRRHDVSKCGKVETESLNRRKAAPLDEIMRRPRAILHVEEEGRE